MLFTPLLPEAASGTLEPRHVVVPLRMMCRRAELVVGRVTALDTTRKVASVDAIDGPVEIGYEHLVLALGSVSGVLPVPVWPSTDTASATSPTRSRFATTCSGSSRRRMPPTRPRSSRGTSRSSSSEPGTPASRRSRARRSRPGRAAVLPPTARSKPALGARGCGAEDPSEIPTKLGDYAAAQLARRGVEIHVATRLESADDRGVVLSDGARIETGTLVWTAGVRPSPAGHGARAAARRPRPDRGRRVPAGAGDRGRVGVGRLRRGSERSHARAGRPTHLAARASAGAAPRTEPDRRAEALSLPDAGAGGHAWPVQRHRRRHGSPAARISRLVLHPYVPPLPAALVSRRLRVVADWTVALFFRRDIAELGSLGHPRRLED